MPTTQRTWEGNAALKRLLVPIDSLAPHPKNPRRHDLAAIQESLRTFGQQRPVLVVPPGRIDPERATIVAGHGTTLGATEEGWTHIAVIESDLSDEAIDSYVAADNRTADLATYDDELLAGLLKPLYDQDALLGSGYGRDDVEQLLADLAYQRMQNEPVDPDAAPTVPEDPKSRLGEVYELGGHRLICGDATDERVVALLFGEETATVMATDPPYGVSLDPKWRERAGKARLGPARDTFQGDERSDWREAFILAPAPVAYVWHGSLTSDLVKAGLEEAGYTIRQHIVWSKTVAAFSRSVYHWRHECAWYAVRGTAPKRLGDRKQTTVWEAASPIHIMAGGGDDGRTSHPTQKPVAIFEPPIANQVPVGGIVYDPFAGSGTCLIAAERLSRRCYAIELDPAFCDVIRQRYADFTGQPEYAP